MDGQDFFEKIEFEHSDLDESSADCEFEQFGLDEASIDCDFEQSDLDQTLTDCEVSDDLNINHQRSTSESSASTVASSTIQMRAARLDYPRSGIISNFFSELNKRNSSITRNVTEKMQKVCIEVIGKMIRTLQLREIVRALNLCLEIILSNLQLLFRLHLPTPVILQFNQTSSSENEQTAEQGDSVRSAQNVRKTGILKKWAAVLLAILVVWWLDRMNVHYQTSLLVEEVDDLKATNGALLKFKVKQLAKDSKCNVTTKLGGLLDFLDSDERRRCSKPIRCNGLSWHLLFKHIIIIIIIRT